MIPQSYPLEAVVSNGPDQPLLILLVIGWEFDSEGVQMNAIVAPTNPRGTNGKAFELFPGDSKIYYRQPQK